MSISSILIRQIRRKRMIDAPFATLLTLMSQGKNVIRRLTDYRSDISGSDGNLYKSFPIAIRIPRSTSRLTERVEVSFANFPDQAGLPTLKADLARTARADFEIVSGRVPSIRLYDKVSYLFSHEDSIRTTDALIIMTFSLKLLEDRKFPFRRYASSTHPLIYEDFVQDL